jgi:hypothetical protein
VHNHLLGLENIQFEIILFGPGFDVCEFGWYKRCLIRRGYQVAIIGIFIQKYEETESVEIRDMDDECRRANPRALNNTGSNLPKTRQQSPKFGFMTTALEKP